MASANNMIRNSMRKKVQFTQINDAAYDITYFDWSGFPEELAETRIYIVKAIANAMRIMD